MNRRPGTEPSFSRPDVADVPPLLGHGREHVVRLFGIHPVHVVRDRVHQRRVHILGHVRAVAADEDPRILRRSDGGDFSRALRDLVLHVHLLVRLA